MIKVRRLLRFQYQNYERPIQAFRDGTGSKAFLNPGSDLSSNSVPVMPVKNAKESIRA